MTITWDEARERVKDIERERHNCGRFAWLPELRTFRELADDASDFDPGTGPWAVEEAPVGGQLSGNNWLIADMGTYDDHQRGTSFQVFVTTDRVRGSDAGLWPATDAAWIVWCRNNWDQIQIALRLAAESIA